MGSVLLPERPNQHWSTPGRLSRWYAGLERFRRHWRDQAAFGTIIFEVSPIRRVVQLNRKIKHLEFIQGVINRLASDSFRVKGWCVVLVAALFVLLALEGRIEFAVITLAPIIAFWGLDGYFLWQERLYRALYDHVRTLEEVEVDFSMNVSAFRTAGRGLGRVPHSREPCSSSTAHWPAPSA